MKNATAADVVKGNEVEYINSDTIISKQNYYLITGEEQQGKTSLLKNTFRRLAEGGIPVVYIDARNIKTSDIDVVIGSELKKQYDNFSIESFLHEDIKTVLIDGIDFIGLNNKYRDLFLSNLKEKFQHIIITCNTSYSYIYPEIYELNDFSVYDLLGLGHAKRTELIEKWISLGKEESIDESTLYEQCDEFKLKLDTIIRKNIVPPKPIYVLILLQMFEAYSQQNLEMTSYGHCYQQLVYQSFDHAKIPKKDVEKYLNVLTELAWRMHTNNGFIPESELPLFFKNY
ncbi:TPA: toll-Interleukin receptor, partial [Citrobacter freundii]|nr:toll-Interleukin receptor [Citrobacter freundii]